MKLLSPILLGLGLLGAATASGSANHLRANTSARQLGSSGSDSESWIYFLFLNGLNALEDLQCGPESCCCNESLDRCQHPHLPYPPPAKKHCSSGGSGSGSGGSGGSQATSDSSASSSSSKNGDDGDSSNYDKSANDDKYSGENDDENNQANYYNNNDDGANGGNNQGNDDGSGEDQYLYNEYNGGSGNANQITGGQSISVWPILIAAIVIGAVAAALVATKKVSFTFANKVFTTCCATHLAQKQYFAFIYFCSLMIA